MEKDTRAGREKQPPSWCVQLWDEEFTSAHFHVRTRERGREIIRALKPFGVRGHVTHKEW